MKQNKNQIDSAILITSYGTVYIQYSQFSLRYISIRIVLKKTYPIFSSNQKLLCNLFEKKSYSAEKYDYMIWGNNSFDINF